MRETVSKRPAITERMKLAAIFYRNHIECEECGVQIISTDVIRWDHYNPLGMGGEHNETNLFPIHKACHDKKTFGSKATSAGSDIGKISKVKRIVRTEKFVVRKNARRGDMRPTPKRKWPQGRKIPVRSFQRRKG